MVNTEGTVRVEDFQVRLAALDRALRFAENIGSRTSTTPDVVGLAEKYEKYLRGE